MLLCPPALPLAQPVSSFLKVRHGVVARFPGLGTETRFVTGRLGLVWGRRHGQSWFLGDSDFHGHGSTGQGRRAPRSVLATERLHAPWCLSPSLGLLRGQSWRLSRIYLQRRKMKRERTSSWWWDVGRASLQGSKSWALLLHSFLHNPRRGILFAIFWRKQTFLFHSCLHSVREKWRQVTVRNQLVFYFVFVFVF